MSSDYLLFRSIDGVPSGTFAVRLFFHFKHRWVFSRNIPIILNERALEPTFDAKGH